jgi:hypothetical protein
VKKRFALILAFILSLMVLSAPAQAQTDDFHQQMIAAGWQLGPEPANPGRTMQVVYSGTKVDARGQLASYAAADIRGIGYIGQHHNVTGYVDTVRVYWYGNCDSAGYTAYYGNNNFWTWNMSSAVGFSSVGCQGMRITSNYGFNYYKCGTGAYNFPSGLNDNVRAVNFRNC